MNFKALGQKTVIILVFAFFMLSIASATTQAHQDETFSELSIKLKAIQVAREIENYILEHPEKTLKDLQNDSYFQKIAVQPVGRTGYTAVTDYDTLTCRFHKNPEIVDINLHTLSGKLPGFWSIMSKTEGGKEAAGVYDWEEADGSIKKKYMYITIINTKTADGVGLSIAATTYPGEYDIKPVQEPENVLQEQKHQISPINITWVILGIISTIIYIFFFLLEIDEKNIAGLRQNLIGLVTSAFFMFIIDIILINTTNPNICFYIIKIIYAFAVFFVFYFMLLMFNLSGLRIKKNTLKLLHIFNAVIASVILFTNAYVYSLISEPNKYTCITVSKAPMHNAIVIILLLYVLAAFVAYIINYKKNEKLKSYLPIFMSLLALVALNIAYSLYYQPKHPSMLFLSLAAFIFAIGFVMFKQGFLKLQKNTIVILLSLTILAIISIFVFSAYNISENMKSTSINDYERQQLLIAQQAANSIEAYVNFIIADTQITAEHPDFASPDPETYGILERMYNRLAISEEGIVLTRIDKNGTLIAKYTKSPEDRKKAVGIHYSKFTGFDSEYVAEVMKTHQATISKPVMTPCGHDAITVLTPIFDQHEFEGILRVTVFIDETFIDKYIKPIHFAESGHAHLIIDNVVFCPRINRTKENSTLQPFENLPLLEKINTGKSGIIKHKFDYTGKETDKTTISAYSPIKIPDRNWAVVTEMPQHEAYAQIQNNINKIWYNTIAIIIILIAIGIIFYVFLTKSLRQQIEQKTGEIRNFNIKLEGIVRERTEEVEQKTKELQNLNITLEKQVEQKTKELAQRLAEEEKSSQAMIYILERQKRTNTLLKESRYEFENKNHELQLQSSQLLTSNKQLEEAEIALKKEKQNVEKKVIERTKELKKEKERVELLLEQKNSFINQLSHDLRTPLTPILTILPVSIKHTKDKDVKYDLEMILRNARYLNSLVINTLNLARLQTNSIEFDKKPVNVSELIKDLMRANKTTYKQYNVNAVNNAKDNIFASADELRVREIIDNIVMNSLKFMSNGGTLTFNASYKSKKEVIFSVSDTGTGIEEEKITKIFEEFYKADESRQNLVGTGLGLSICQKLLEKMHGTIRAESEGKNKGTTIYFTLPAYHPEKSQNKI